MCVKGAGDMVPTQACPAFNPGLFCYMSALTDQTHFALRVWEQHSILLIVMFPPPPFPLNGLQRIPPFQETEILLLDVLAGSSSGTSKDYRVTKIIWKKLLQLSPHGTWTQP